LNGSLFISVEKFRVGCANGFKRIFYMKNFWQEIRKPIYALAPMAGVTDSAFRQICKSFSADVVYSEMASATALVYNPKKTLEMLRFSEEERPYVAQLFGSNPEHFVAAARLLSEKGVPVTGKFEIQNSKFKIPDGIDINFGCPVKKVQKQGAGAILMNNLPLAREIVKSVIANTDLPVSIKIRAQVGKVDALRFLDYLKELDIKAVMIHGRSLKGGFSGEVNTEIIKKSRDYFSGIILANGGVYTASDARKMLDVTSADGIGIARGAMGRPWIFNEIKNQKLKIKNYEDVSKIALRHAKLAYRLKGNPGIVEMRKHLCWYTRNLPGARKLRQGLVEVNTLAEIEEIIKKIVD
jgi:tRNA-dihydrouridine synthase B